jgi:diguanylate cyclase (GGDEF)-like protein
MPRLSPISRITSGIRFRMSMVFLLVFVGMAAGSVWHLQASMGPTFVRMEHDNALRSAERVVGGLDAQLTNLNTLTRDWAFWDDMYQYAQKPNSAFELSNMGVESMKNIGLIGVMVLSPKREVLGFQGLAQSDAQTLRAEYLLAYKDALLMPLQSAQHAQRCGYLQPQNAIIFLCASRISRSDGSGDPVGVVVMVRELTSAALREIEKQSKESFQLLPPNSHTSETQWSVAAMTHLPVGRVSVNYEAHTLTLHYPVPDLMGKPLRSLQIQLARTLVEEGELVTYTTARQMATIALVTGAMLLVAAHFWLVLPIARLKRDIRAIHKNKAWGTGVRQNRRDEIGALAREVNGLLTVIHSQVQELQSLSMTDPLTGLSNRRHFDKCLADEVSRVERSAQPLSVVVLDIDYFKQFNDHYGHPAGDLALQKVAQVLRDSTRKVDLAARIGGEEFAVLLPGTNEASALFIAEKILQTLRDTEFPHVKSQVSHVLTASAGVASLGAGSDAAVTLMAHADQALYAAKAAGRNRAFTFSGQP